MNEIWVGTTLSLSRMRGRREREEKWEEEEVWEGDAGIGGGGGEEGGQVGRGRSSWVSPWWGCCQGDPRDASEAPSRTQRERERSKDSERQDVHTPGVCTCLHTCTCPPIPPEPTRRPELPTSVTHEHSVGPRV